MCIRDRCFTAGCTGNSGSGCCYIFNTCARLFHGIYSGKQCFKLPCINAGNQVFVLANGMACGQRGIG